MKVFAYWLAGPADPSCMDSPQSWALGTDTHLTFFKFSYGMSNPKLTIRAQEQDCGGKISYSHKRCQLEKQVDHTLFEIFVYFLWSGKPAKQTLV